MSANDKPEPIRAELLYPRESDRPDTVIVGMIDVCAADDLIITFDFERNGWRIGMDETRQAKTGMEIFRENQEVAFIPAWNDNPGPEGVSA